MEENLMDTSEMDAIRADHSDTLACAIEKLGSSIKRANDYDGRQKKQDTIKTVATVASLAGVLLTLLIFLMTIGGWKKEVEMINTANGEQLKQHSTKIETHNKDIGEIKSDVRVIRVEQSIIKDDVKKILDKID